MPKWYYPVILCNIPAFTHIFIFCPGFRRAFNRGFILIFSNDFRIDDNIVEYFGGW